MQAADSSGFFARSGGMAQIIMSHRE